MVSQSMMSVLRDATILIHLQQTCERKRLHKEALSNNTYVCAIEFTGYLGARLTRLLPLMNFLGAERQ